METSPDPNREMVLLEKIEYDPDITQANLAAQLGVAVGTVNWHLKRFVAKGYVKVKRAQRRKLRYIITPEGIAFRARLTVNYIDQSMQLYRLVRDRVQEAVKEVKLAGYDSVRIVGDGDIADICRLTCIEQGLNITESEEAPVLELNDLKVILHIEDNLKRKVTVAETQEY
jgi:DNA-binding MarR family transcriptional regulator